jgi:hypothetical protein
VSVGKYKAARRVKMLSGHPGWEKGKRVVRNGLVYKIISRGSYVFTGDSGLWHYRVRQVGTMATFTFIPMMGDKII